MSPYENMALDEAVFLGIQEGVSQPLIRFYDWDPPTVSLGNNQKTEEEVNLDAVKSKGYAVVRRPTGGRMVLHKNEVTYAVITSLDGKMKGNITQTYSEISKALSAGLTLLGIPNEFEKGSLSVSEQRMNANPCFTSSSRYEINCLGKKIIGSAQVRSKIAFLQHGSILLNENQEEIAELLPGISDVKRAKIAEILRKKTIAVNMVTSKKYNFAEAVGKFIQGFKEYWIDDEFELVESINSSERLIMSKLLKSKYKC